MCDQLFADVTSGMAEKLAGYAIKCLAVGGGFLFGYFVGKGGAWALDRWVFASKAPVQLKKACALVCGVIAAILVALIVFGEGGSGLFGGGNKGDGKGTAPDQKGTSDPTSPVTNPKKDDTPAPKTTDPTPTKPADTIIRVTVLGGSDVLGDERYYLLDGDPKPKTFDELKAAVLARREKEKGTVALALHFRPTNAPSLDPLHYSISQLTKWAKETAKLDVTFAAPK